MNRKTGHVSYAFNQCKQNIDSLGFTHNSFDKAKKEKLIYNINPKDTSNCYVKTKIEKQKYNTYREKEEFKDYRIHKVDRPKIDKIISHRDKKRR